MEFIAKWYDHEFIVAIDPDPIIADSEDDAIKKAWERYDGTPPTKMVYLERCHE